MKKIILSSLLIGAVVAVKAQNLSLGPVVGINHSWLTNTGDNKQFNAGLNAGGTITYSFNPQWGIGADVLFTRNGLQQESSMANVTTNRDISLDYVRFQPKVIHFFGDLGDAVRPKLFLGGSVGVLTGGHVTTEVTNNSETTNVTTKTDARDNYNSVDAGLMAGAGVNWRIGKATWLNTDLVYYNGLTDVTKSSSWSANRSLGLNVGVTFPIGTVQPK